MKFSLGLEELSFYRPGGKLILEAGQFKVWVGGDSTAQLESAFGVR